MRLAEFIIAMLGLGISIPRIAVRTSDSESSGGAAPAGVALKADFSDPNTNEAWVFW